MHAADAHPFAAANTQLGSNTGGLDEQTLQRGSQGVGAFDTQGRKHHEATDAQPGQFGVQGGAHLNSADNRPPPKGDVGTMQGGQGQLVCSSRR